MRTYTKGYISPRFNAACFRAAGIAPETPVSFWVHGTKIAIVPDAAGKPLPKTKSSAEFRVPTDLCRAAKFRLVNKTKYPLIVEQVNGTTALVFDSNVEAQ